MLLHYPILYLASHNYLLISIMIDRCRNTNYISTITTKSKSKTHYHYDSHQKINSIFFSNTMSTSVYPTINLDNFDTSTTCSKQKSHVWATPYKFNSKFIRRGLLNLHFSIFQLLNFPTF